jgi:multidrug resistance efflux pump
MASPRKRRRRAAGEPGTAVARVAVTTVGTHQPGMVPVRRDAISELLGASADPRLVVAAPGHSRRRWAIAAAVVLILAVAGLLWVQYRTGHTTSNNAAVRANVSEIGTRIGGRVAAVTVDVGDRVEAGQVLVQLEDRHLVAELEEARAQVTGARERAAAARRTHALQRQLHGMGGVSRAELERADSERRVREADLLAAQARVTRAEAELASSAIRAPQAGSIVRRIVQPGGALEAGQPVLAMWLGDDLWVEAWIDEADLESVRLGGKAAVTFHAFPGRQFTGVVERVGLATDLEHPDSAMPHPRFARMRAAPVLGVRIRLDDPPPHLVPGLSAMVAIKKEP